MRSDRPVRFLRQDVRMETEGEMEDSCRYDPAAETYPTPYLLWPKLGDWNQA